MPIIGEFEAAVKAADPDREPDQFKLQGHTFTIAPEINIIALGRFARAARAGANTDDMEGLASLIDTVASVVIPEDENRFLDVASKHRVDADLLLKIVAAVMEAQSGTPIEPSSDSSGGRSTTGPNSRALSSSEGSSTRTPDWRDTAFARRELAADPNRFADIKSIAEHGADLAATQAS